MEDIWLTIIVRIFYDFNANLSFKLLMIIEFIWKILISNQSISWCILFKTSNYINLANHVSLSLDDCCFLCLTLLEVDGFELSQNVPEVVHGLLLSDAVSCYISDVSLLLLVTQVHLDEWVPRFDWFRLLFQDVSVDFPVMYYCPKHQHWGFIIGLQWRSSWS